jgi:glyoxylase-like metal-dependent hydrolase (beta-lactamase superfamily II)
MTRLPQPIATGVYQVGLGGVNAFLIDLDDGGLLLVDAGFARSGPRIGQAIRDLGRAPSDLRAVVMTHLHGDHTGALAEVKSHTGAEVWMHPADAALVREGVFARPLDPAGPGLLRRGIARLGALRPVKPGEPIAVEHEVYDGETLPFAGLTAVHTPGHTAGHLALLLPRDGGVLFAGDAATNLPRLGVGPIYEHIDEGMRSLRRLADLQFETALFSHGRPLAPQAAERFRARFSED